jgi:fructokinase
MAVGSVIVVAIGEILWDEFPSGKRMGGAPANFIHHVRELGGNQFQPLLVSAVGDDPSGREILQNWNERGLSAKYLAVDPKHSTGSVGVAVAAEGKPVYEIRRNVAWDFLPGEPTLRGLAEQADAICFGTLAQRAPQSRKAIRKFLAKAKPGALRILDLNLRAPFASEEIVTESLPLADVLKVNAEELLQLADWYALSGDAEAVAQALLRRTELRLIALTRGADGSALYAPAEKSVRPGVPVAVVDTVGAGDAFTAALAIGMLRGFPLDKINENAIRAAAFVCTQSGAMPEIPEAIKTLFVG